MEPVTQGGRIKITQLTILVRAIPHMEMEVCRENTSTIKPEPFCNVPVNPQNLN
jgi:hypothetical protein